MCIRDRYAERVRHFQVEDNEFVDETQLVDEWADSIVNKLEESLSAN